jgi:pimeloyl-ACP methyl ester carboxylesterase
MADHIAELVAVEKQELPETALGDMVAPCVEEILASGADLPAYNTENNARDVRALMTALGYPEYDLYGISYGTAWRSRSCARRRRACARRSSTASLRRP